MCAGGTQKTEKTAAKPQHSPSKAEPIQYSVKMQQSKPKDTSPQFYPEGIKKIQEVMGTFGWYTRATNPTMKKN